MCTGVVGTELIGHGSVGMADGYLPQMLVSTITCCPKKQFEVEHVVDDGIVAPVVADVARPTQDGADQGIEEGGQCVGTCQEDLAIALVACQTISVDETWDNEKAQIMVVSRTLCKER